MSTLDQQPLEIAICASRDFTRRMVLAAPSAASPLSLHSGNLSEMRALAVTHRSDMLVVELHREVVLSDVQWIRENLQEVRQRLGRKIYIVLAVTAPEKFTLGGALLFANEHSLEPSGLIDNLLISPPAAIAHLSLEAQFINCVGLVVEVLQHSPDGQVNLPALWSPEWAPTMCDPKSRETWMRWLPRYARYVSENPIIIGPTGTGKTRLAAALHELSKRDGPFVSITPRDFSSMELVQAELFGAVQGAYTGAVEKWGLVKRAERGTLFIDELQSIDLELQGKLITFIENKSYRRVGESISHTADVRFVFASNRPLDELVQQGKLRDDFAYRLERLQLELPPLAERRLDIAAGLCFALASIARQRTASAIDFAPLRGKKRVVEGVTAEAYARLYSAPWPGNLRQLENTVARMLECADIRDEVLASRASAEQALQSSLGRQHVSARDVFSETVARLARNGEQLDVTDLSEFSAVVQQTAREIALEYAAGESQAAASLIGETNETFALLSQRADRK